MLSFKIGPLLEEELGEISVLHVDIWKETYIGIMPDEILRKKKYEDSREIWNEIFLKSKSDLFVRVAKVKNILSL